MHDKNAPSVYPVMATKARRLLYSWGNGDFGRLGLGPNFSNQTLPTLCETLLGSTVTNVECGGAHTVALTGMLHQQYSVYKYEDATKSQPTDLWW